MFSFQALLAPLQGLMARFVQAVPGAATPVPLMAGLAQRACSTRAHPSAGCRERPRRPLRVLRVVETSRVPSSGAGRMVISGRMADVCAELDRLAALEASGR
jgi:hypothetical protein